MTDQRRGPPLWTVPATRDQVADFIRAHHRHHKPPTGDVFRFACIDETGAIRGIASVGRPVSPDADDGWTLEVNRVATDGVFGGCSLLYAAARRIAFDLGYRDILTYTLPAEGGGSLRGAGWICEGLTGSPEKGWASRPGRDVSHPQGDKLRWRCRNPNPAPVAPAWPVVESPQATLFRMAE